MKMKVRKWISKPCIRFYCGYMTAIVFELILHSGFIYGGYLVAQWNLVIGSIICGVYGDSFFFTAGILTEVFVKRHELFFEQ